MTKTRSPITTHVLDLSRGVAAAGVPVVLEERAANGNWTVLAKGRTNGDGRVEDLLSPNTPSKVGIFRLTFDVEAYTSTIGTENFHPEVTVTFRITDPSRHHHVPLLLSAYGYSTYRGT